MNILSRDRYAQYIRVRCVTRNIFEFAALRAIYSSSLRYAQYIRVRCVTRNIFEFAVLRAIYSSLRHDGVTHMRRESNFPDFQGIFLYFRDFSQNLKFP